MQTLIENDLVDELSLTVSPVLLGGGKRLFRDSGRMRRRSLVDCRPTSTGCLLLTYRPTG